MSLSAMRGASRGSRWLREREPEPEPLATVAPRRGPDRGRLVGLVGVTAALVLGHNLLVDRYDLGPVYVAVGVALTVLAAAGSVWGGWAARWLPAGRFGPAWPWVVLAALLTLALWLFDPVADQRLADAGAGELGGRVLESLFGVAVVEEVVFRQGLLVGWSRLARRPARGIGPAGVGLVASSLAFGLWHVAAEQARVEAAGGSSWEVLLGVAATGLLAGPFLTVIRLRSGGLAAPVITHASFNVAVAVGVWL